MDATTAFTKARKGPRVALHRTFRRLAAATAPHVEMRFKLPKGEWSPDLVFFSHLDVRTELEALLAERPEATYLDVGGRDGKQKGLAEGFEYRILDIDPSAIGPNVLNGDICSCPQIPDETFDVTYSRDVFEHLKEPWRAAEECVRITKPGGLLIHVAPFAWRYHPSPVDCYRYTHEGMTHLFERTGRVETIRVGYDTGLRRKDMKGVRPDGRDRPPVDELGGWRENWLVTYVGRRV